MRHFSRSTAGVLLLAAPAFTQAQQRDTAQLANVVVTPTRVPTPLASVTQPITVLNGDDLRARGVKTVALALREVPGVMVVQSGSYGGVTSVFIRGGESRYAKVLIDGVPVNTVGGSLFFENLTTDNIDRIEVVRGPSSAQYGADAMSGVIQIFTKQGQGAPHADASIRGGTFGTVEGDASIRGGTTLGTYSLGGGIHRTDGILPFNNNYNNGTLSGALTVTPDAATTIKLSSRYTAAVYHFPTDYTGAVVDTNSYTSQHRLTVGLDAARTILPNLTLRVLGADNDIHDLSEDLQATGTSAAPAWEKTSSLGKGYRRSGEGRIEWALSPIALITAGGQYEREQQQTTGTTTDYTTSLSAGTSTVTQQVNHRSTHGYFVAVQGNVVPRVAYDASVRTDRHSDYKDATTYHTGVNVGVTSATHLRASYGTAFNAPSFDATQGSAYNRPNAQLQPEQAHSVDVAIEQALLGDRVRASAGAFDQRFSQLIQYVFATPKSYYDNLTAARAHGYESELHAVLLTGLTADANYTQTIARVTKVPPAYTGAQPGQALLRRPSHSGSLNVAYALPQLGSIAATASYVGKRPDMDFSSYPYKTVTLQPYVKLDLSASVDVIHTPLHTIALTGRVENALDKKYQDVLHFPAPGRAVFIGARVTTGR